MERQVRWPVLAVIALLAAFLVRVPSYRGRAEEEATRTPVPKIWNFFPLIFGLPLTTSTSTPTPPVEGLIYFSTGSRGTAGGVAFEKNDIFAYHSIMQKWFLIFDGSDMGLDGLNLDAFEFLPDGSLVFSVDATVPVLGLGDLMGEDIVRFIPVSFGSATDGDLEWYFDGSDVGLSGSSENVDAIGFAPDNRLLVSTSGGMAAGAFQASDEDLLAFTARGMGKNTSGSWSLYLDGSRGDLNADTEDLDAVWSNPSGNGFYLSTVGNYSVPGASGAGADIFLCWLIPGGGGSPCQYSPYWVASNFGLGGQNIDGLGIIPNASAPAANPTCDRPFRIMALGDSITRGQGSSTIDGYRRRLSLGLGNAGYGTNFTGSRQDGNVDFDRDHEGHGGWHAKGGEEGGLLPHVYDWLQTNPADVVLLHIGTNDIGSNGESAQEVAQILDEIDRYSTNVIVVLAQIINRIPYSQRTTQYNADLRVMAEARIAQGDQLYLVDMEHSLDYTKDMTDYIHPNDLGYFKMASVWQNTLDDILPKCP